MILRSLLTRFLFGQGRRLPPGQDSTFESLLPDSADGVEKVRRLVERVNGNGGTYHRLCFGSDLTVEGDYDLFKYIHYYDLPADLAGKTVLDVGSASGFWALECARRGATVTAIDIYDESLVGELSKALDLDVTYLKRSVYDLPGTGWAFDLVICGSLLLHLPDLVGAAGGLRSVCVEKAVISTACMSYSRFTSRPICEFRGRRASDGAYFHFWELSGAALRSLLRTAGFSQVSAPRHFLLESEPGRTRFDTPHVVATARA